MQLSLVALGLTVLAAVACAQEYKDYCIVGGGVAGTQIAYYYHKAGRDYVLLERNNIPGSFFSKFPRHKYLISSNKVYTGRTNKEFNLRHDWNSIMCDNENFRFKNYDTRYFARSARIVDMARDIIQYYGINIRYNQKVVRVHRQPQSETCQYDITTAVGDKWCCKVAIVSSGIENLKIPKVDGLEHVEMYTNMSVDPNDFIDQSVLVVGLGNSAFETSKNLYGHASFVHMMGHGPVRHSWDTHYVGDVRGINNELLDAYQLKSLDGVIYTGRGAAIGYHPGGIESFKIVKGPDGKKYLHSKVSDVSNKDQFALRRGYDRILFATGFQWDETIFANDTRVESNGFDPKRPTMPVGKYPVMNWDYEHPTHKNLFFAGCITHGLEYGKSSNGFIHGFRYTTRALQRLLEVRYEKEAWPHVTDNIENLAAHISRRANEASGVYHMWGHLADVVIIDKVDKTFKYLEEFPVRLIVDLQRYAGHQYDPSRHVMVVMTFQFGKFKDPFALGTANSYIPTAHKSAFLHPNIYYYAKPPTPEQFDDLAEYVFLPKPTNVHHILSDFTLVWDGAEAHLFPLRKWLEHCLQHDLRTFYPSTCMAYAMGSAHAGRFEGLPLSCKNYLMAA